MVIDHPAIKNYRRISPKVFQEKNYSSKPLRNSSGELHEVLSPNKKILDKRRISDLSYIHDRSIFLNKDYIIVFLRAPR
jgi:hypothetical protein